jgi:C4-dicarboxylate-binding protein DctP
VATNKAWWDKLPPDVQTGVKAALAVATKWNWENTEKENADAYAQLKKLGKSVYELDTAQRDKWVAAVQPLWKQFGDDAVGPEVMGRLKEINVKYK